MEKRTLRFRTAVKAVMIALLLGVEGMARVHAQSFTVGDLNYTTNENGVTVTGHVYGDGTLVIPESVIYNGRVYSVTKIGVHAFSNCSFTGDIVITYNSFMVFCISLFLSEPLQSIQRKKEIRQNEKTSQ